MASRSITEGSIPRHIIEILGPHIRRRLSEKHRGNLDRLYTHNAQACVYDCLRHSLGENNTIREDVSLTVAVHMFTHPNYIEYQQILMVLIDTCFDEWCVNATLDRIEELSK